MLRAPRLLVLALLTGPRAIRPGSQRGPVDQNGDPAHRGSHRPRSADAVGVWVRADSARPPGITATSFDDLDDTQLHALLGEGFSVRLRSNLVALWNHDIDFQPPDRVDAARLRGTARQRPRGRPAGEFSELWWSLSRGDNRLSASISKAGRTERATIVGDHFIYARNRAHDLPAGESLAALVEKTHATRAQIIEMLDCEFSYGLVRGGRVPWTIVHSTLPWREGKPLDFAREITVDEHGTLHAAIEGFTVPVNTFTAGDLQTIF
ncbi:MAG: hypothetical protein WKG01_30380 [Kofleriaceae bacterium]